MGYMVTKTREGSSLEQMEEAWTKYGHIRFKQEHGKTPDLFRYLNSKGKPFPKNEIEEEVHEWTKSLTEEEASYVIGAVQINAPDKPE